MSHNYGYDSDSDRWDAWQKEREEKVKKQETDILKDRIRELEADNAKLLGVIGSLKDLMVMRDTMIGNFISDLQKAMNDQIRGVMDKTLTEVIRVTQEKLDA